MSTNTSEQETKEVKMKRVARRVEAGERERVLADWAASGKSVAEMVAATGRSSYTLYRWRKAARGQQAKKSEAATKLLAVPPPAVPMSGGWIAEIVIGAVSVRVSAGCSAGWVRQMIEELKSC